MKNLNSKGKLNAFSRDADLNPLWVQTGFAVKVSHFADIGTPRSNINNTAVSPYESVTALRVGWWSNYPSFKRKRVPK